MLILILSLTFALLIAIFALQNASPVAIHFFWLFREVPLVLIILGSAFLGALIMLLLALWRELRLKRKKRLENANSEKQLRADLENTTTEAEKSTVAKNENCERDEHNL